MKAFAIKDKTTNLWWTWTWSNECRRGYFKVESDLNLKPSYLFDTEKSASHVRGQIRREATISKKQSWRTPIKVNSDDLEIVELTMELQ